jgi:hypothetical protein
MSSLLKYIKITNYKIAVDGLWHLYHLSASIEPEAFSLDLWQIPSSLHEQASMAFSYFYEGVVTSLPFLHHPPKFSFSGPCRSLLPPNSQPLTPIDRFSVSTLSLTSSHVLLAGIILSQENILLLWDLQFFMLLASLSLHTVDPIVLPLHPTCFRASDLTKTHVQVTG